MPRGQGPRVPSRLRLFQDLETVPEFLQGSSAVGIRFALLLDGVCASVRLCGQELYHVVRVVVS